MASLLVARYSQQFYLRSITDNGVAPTSPGLSVFAALLQWYIMHRKTCKQVGRRQPVIVASSLQIAGPRPNNSVVRRVRGLCDPLVHSLLSEVSRHSPPSITGCSIESDVTEF